MKKSVRTADRLRPGAVLGRYALTREVGRGGMGVVWAARQRGSHGFARTVALKAMLPHLAEDPAFEAMFLAEARLVSGIEHANVCRVLDLGTDDGVVFQVLEWIDGASLASLARSAGGTLPAPVAASIARDVARGLHAAHTAVDASGEPLGVVHRDVSPQNVLVGLDGLARISDFGVATSSAVTGATRPGAVKGKVPYMAPEQIYGEALDARTDVFALGVVLFEAIGGRHPFEAATDVGILARIADGDEAPSLRSVADGCPEDIAAAVARALAKAPEDRFASAGDLASALSEALRSMAGGSHEDVARRVRGAAQGTTHERRTAADGTSYEVSPERGRQRRRVAVVASVASAAIVAVLAVTWRPRPASTPPPPALAAAIGSLDPAPVPAPLTSVTAPIAPIALVAEAPAPSASAPPSATGRSLSRPAANPVPRPAAPAAAKPGARPADHDELRTRE